MPIPWWMSSSILLPLALALFLSLPRASFFPVSKVAGVTLAVHFHAVTFISRHGMKIQQTGFWPDMITGCYL